LRIEGERGWDGECEGARCPYPGTTIGTVRVSRLLGTLATVVVASFLSSKPLLAQESVSAPKVAQVRIIRGPELEMARGDLAILRWTTNNLGGSYQHFAVVHYGTDPDNLDQVAKSPIIVSRSQPETLFRVRMPNLKPRTKYYYVVTSMQSNGKSDEVRSPINHFTTPGPDDRIVAYPQPN
jgi:hypothetical protein